MENTIDIKKLTKEEQYKLVIEILKFNKDLKSTFEEVVPNPKDELDLSYIEKLIDQDFERFDEVFRKLA
jgi:hypothetical protein